jgi:hypothetical protein
MFKRYWLYLLLFAGSTILFTACNKTKRISPTLQQADNLMEKHPQDALQLLRKMPIPSQRYQYEVWNVLTTQALDRLYQPITPREAIMKRTTAFFDSIEDPKMQSKSHCYLGRIFQDKEDDINASKEFYTALIYAQQENDSLTMIRLMSNIGFILWNNGLLAEADSTYRAILPYEISENDTEGLAICYNRLGDFAMLQKKPDYKNAQRWLSASYCYAIRTSNKYITSNVEYSLSVLYANTNRFNDALMYAKRCQSSLLDSAQIYDTYLTLGKAFADAHRTDSAIHYLGISLNSNKYETKRQAYKLLSDIYVRLNNKDKALYYHIKYDESKDSVLQVKHPVNIVSSMKDIIKHQADIRSQSLTKSIISTFSIIFILLISSIFVCILFYSFLKKKDRKMMRILSYMKKNNERISLREQVSNTDIYKKLISNLQYNEQIVERKDKRTLLSSDWKDLISEINTAMPLFVSSLTERYEALTSTDIHFCCLVRMEFSYPDIANIQGYTQQAIDKRKQEIKERMNLQSTKEIREIVMNI